MLNNFCGIEIPVTMYRYSAKYSVYVALHHAVMYKVTLLYCMNMF